MIEVHACRMTFRCRSCSTSWSWDYVVRSQRFSGGTEIDQYFRDGVSVSPPFRGPRCPRCGGVRVACVEATQGDPSIQTG